MRVLPRSIRWLIDVLAVALVYCVAGRLALLLAIPPGYASAVWPAAGLALAGILRCGYRAWPGVVLGSFLVNIWTSWDATSAAAMVKSLILASSIGVGAALQALVGAWLVRRVVGYPTPLTQARDILMLLLLGGPVSCLTNATWSVTSLLLAGALSWSAYPFNWWTWWVGDTIGAILIAPMVLLWAVPPQQMPRRRRLVVSVPLGLICAVVVLLFLSTSALEQRRLKLEFEQRADQLAHKLTHDLEIYIDILYAIERLYASTPAVDRAAFHTFTNRFLSRYPGLQALSWDRRIADSERAAFEDAVRQEGVPGFQIVESNAQGQLVRAGQRSEYVVVTYIEPSAGNEKALGYDVASDLVRRAFLSKARDLGKPMASSRIALVQETEGKQGLLVFMPIYTQEGHPDDPLETRRSALRGYATGIFRIKDMVDASLKDMDRHGMALRLYDDLALEPERLLYDEDSRMTGKTETSSPPKATDRQHVFQKTSRFDVAGRPWRLECLLPLDYLMAHRSWQAWGVLAGGLLFAGLLGALLLIVTGRNLEIETLVDERTAELRQANALLQQQITERQQAEEAQARSYAELARRDKIMRSLLEDLQAAKEHLEEQGRSLHVTNQRLQEMSTLKDEFVANVSHELRTPLTAIKEGISLTLDQALGAINEEQRDFLTTVDQNVDRLTELINTMLDLSKIEAGRLPLARRHLALPSLLEQMVKSYKALAGQRTITLDLAPAPEVFADADRVLQVLGNLISNAVKFTKEHGAITLGLHQADGAVAVSVRDDGIGIAKDDLDKLFQKFSQVGPTEHRPRGTGLGLALCKELVELHKGTITVTSEVGRGSTFTFTLPIYTPRLELEEAFAEQLAVAKHASRDTVSLIVLNPEPLLGAELLDPTPVRLQTPEDVARLIRRHLHSGDAVIPIDPQRILILTVADAPGIETIVTRLQGLFASRSGSRVQSAEAVVRFGSARYPADGGDVHALFAKATDILTRHVEVSG